MSGTRCCGTGSVREIVTLPHYNQLSPTTGGSDRPVAAGHAVVVARSGIGAKRTIRRQIPSDGERHVPPRATTLPARSETGCLTDDALLTAPARTVRIVAHAHSFCFRVAFADNARAARASAGDRLAGRMRTCRNGDDSRRLDQLDGSAIDPNAKQRIRFLPLINAVVELCLPVELIRCEVKITIAGDRKRIGPEDSRIVRDGFPLAVGAALTNSVAFVVARVARQAVTRMTLFSPQRTALVGRSRKPQSSGEPCFGLPQAGCLSLPQEQRRQSGSILNVFLAIVPVPQRVAMLWIA